MVKIALRFKETFRLQRSPWLVYTYSFVSVWWNTQLFWLKSFLWDFFGMHQCHTGWLLILGHQRNSTVDINTHLGCQTDNVQRPVVKINRGVSTSLIMSMSLNFLDSKLTYYSIHALAGIFKFLDLNLPRSHIRLTLYTKSSCSPSSTAVPSVFMALMKAIAKILFSSFLAGI